MDRTHNLETSFPIPHCRNSSKIRSKDHRNWGKINTSNTHIHDRSLSWLSTGTSIKSGWVKL